MVYSYSGGVAVQQKTYSAGNYDAVYYATYYIPETLRKVTLTNYTTTRFAFYGCSMLSEITLSSKTSIIGEMAFYNCKNLTKVNMPNPIKQIGDKAFYGCFKLEEIILDKVLNKIGADSFTNCSSLKKVYFHGDESTWKNISISTTGNLELMNSDKFYYSELEPTIEGNYWHYKDDIITIW